jgi:hypothetical protein
MSTHTIISEEVKEDGEDSMSVDLWVIFDQNRRGKLSTVDCRFSMDWLQTATGATDQIAIFLF